MSFIRGLWSRVSGVRCDTVRIPPEGLGSRSAVLQGIQYALMEDYTLSYRGLNIIMI